MCPTSYRTNTAWFILSTVKSCSEVIFDSNYDCSLSKCPMKMAAYYPEWTITVC